jgi:hypothetical protein
MNTKTSRIHGVVASDTVLLIYDIWGKNDAHVEPQQPILGLERPPGRIEFQLLLSIRPAEIRPANASTTINEGKLR